MKSQSLMPIRWMRTNEVRFLRQDLLPYITEYTTTNNYRIICLAIKRLWIRGAPVIGISGAMAIALAAYQARVSSIFQLQKELRPVFKEISQTRPTAKNLFYALERMQRILDNQTSVPTAKKALKIEALSILEQEVSACQKIAQNGALLLPHGNVLTHCNTGSLACSGIGTALGIITKAYEEGLVAQVLVDETRPLLQGARLTAFELKKARIPHRLITDSMAAWAMQNNLVQSVVVGADCIVQNGDTINKIGTYSLAVLARQHHIPFYVAAPISTFDFKAEGGRDIIIEERDGREVTSFGTCVTAPPNTKSYNPAFDITPAELITAIITDKGVFRAPYSF